MHFVSMLKLSFKAMVHNPLKKFKARAAVDGSNGELSTVPRESSKSDNMHGPLMCGVRPIASNGVT